MQQCLLFANSCVTVLRLSNNIAICNITIIVLDIRGTEFLILGILYIGFFILQLRHTCIDTSYADPFPFPFPGTRSEGA